jgi:hypothetical protein
MYVGALMSTLEVIPLGFLIAQTVVLWRRGEYKTELQKTLLTFVMVAAFGGAIGVAAFGAGLINTPVVNYYLHCSQGTMVHAHLAMPMAYGVPTMHMWVAAFLLAGASTEQRLRRLRIAAVVMAVGLWTSFSGALTAGLGQGFDLGTEWPGALYRLIEAAAAGSFEPIHRFSTVAAGIAVFAAALRHRRDTPLFALGAAASLVATALTGRVVLLALGGEVPKP